MFVIVAYKAIEALQTGINTVEILMMVLNDLLSTRLDASRPFAFAGIAPALENSPPEPLLAQVCDLHTDDVVSRQSCFYFNLDEII